MGGLKWLELVENLTSHVVGMAVLSQQGRQSMAILLDLILPVVPGARSELRRIEASGVRWSKFERGKLRGIFAICRS